MSSRSIRPSGFSHSAMLTRAMSAPLLSREEELELFRRAKEDGDRSALNHVVNCHLRLVASIATRFRGFGVTDADLFQQGVVGMMQAAERFDGSHGARFSTYASWWVRSEMRDQVMRSWSLVRTGTTVAQKRLFFRLKPLLKGQKGEDGDGLPAEVIDDIAEQLKVRPKDVEDMHGRLRSRDMSLNAPVIDDSDGEWIDQIEDDSAGPEQLVDRRMRREMARDLIAEAMECLTGREYFIIKERKLAEDPATLAKLGLALGISKERVRQLERDALVKMTAHIARELGQPEERLSLPF